MKISSKVFGVSAVVVLLMVAQAAGPLVPGAAAAPAPGPVPVQAFGTTYGELSARWWQWLLSIPYDINPNRDTTGVNCGVGQFGNVWFLAGTFGGDATRSCTVPAGKGIFLPLINGVVYKPKDTETVLDLRRQAAEFIDTVAVLRCEIDGVAVDDLFSFRVQSPSFSTLVRSGGLIAAKFYDLMVSDGYWLLLSPLPTGQHTIHFHAETNQSFVVDVTYNLTVQ